MTSKQSLKLPKVPFYFIRHGQTDWNYEHKAMGVTDIPMNELGESQAQKAIDLLRDVPITKIFHSPLKRAKRTAEILNETLQCEMVAIDELKEFNLGSYAGEVIGDWFDDWLAGRSLPQGETFTEFVERSLIGVERALQEEGPVLIVAHGGTYWAIQQALELLELPDLANCVPSKFLPPGEAKAEWTFSTL